MVQFVLQLCVAALMYISSTNATPPNPSYRLVEIYDYRNFFDKFNFFESNFSTGNYNNVDPTSGYVNYRNRTDAENLGMIAVDGTELVVGVNAKDTFDPMGKGRDSVRIESKINYNHGLFIADFTHLPKPTCGVWPAFWTYGIPWPTYGELDIIENWNEADYNMITLHTNNATINGSCLINQDDMLNKVVASNCDVYTDENPRPNESCNTDELLGQWGSKSGGVYAMEWTSRGMSVWSWNRLLTPLDILHKEPNPRLWGKPHFFAGGQSCDIDTHVANQRLVLNTDFCGVAVGNGTAWFDDFCPGRTGYDNCHSYVANNPGDFADVYWKIKSIEVYEA